MKQYNEKQLQQNYENFLKAIEKTFDGERLEKLLHMYSEGELGLNLMVSPASGNVNYHNAYDGGYIDHVMNVVKNSLRMMKFYEEQGGLINFTQEELLFSAFHHDLGKLGERGEPHFIPNDNDWQVKKGQIYSSNTSISYMTHTDRTFYLLNKYGIQYSENEFFGIKLTDGIYDEDNMKYLKTFDINKAQRSNIGHILHFADHMSTLIERDSQQK